MNIQSILSDKIKQAMIAAGADEQCDALIRQSGKPQFGDYQANGIMAAAKKLGLNPREFAQKVLVSIYLQWSILFREYSKTSLHSSHNSPFL